MRTKLTLLLFVIGLFVPAMTMQGQPLMRTHVETGDV